MRVDYNTNMKTELRSHTDMNRIRIQIIILGMRVMRAHVVGST